MRCTLTDVEDGDNDLPVDVVDDVAFVALGAHILGIIGETNREELPIVLGKGAVRLALAGESHLELLALVVEGDDTRAISRPEGGLKERIAV